MIQLVKANDEMAYNSKYNYTSWNSFGCKMPHSRTNNKIYF